VPLEAGRRGGPGLGRGGPGGALACLTRGGVALDLACGRASECWLLSLLPRPEPDP
jgi:hypothetical protein